MGDLKFALRALRKRPGLTLAAITCLGLGIGVNASLFGVVRTLLFRTPPLLSDPGRVVRLYFNETMGSMGRVTQASTSVVTFESLKSRSQAFDNLAAFFPADLSLGGGPDAAPVYGLLVSASYFRLFSAHPALGAFFTAGEDRLGVTPTAVLGYGLWQRRFGGDSGVLGQTLRIYRTPFTVIGVAPPELTGPNLERVDLWLALRPAGAALEGTDWVQNSVGSNSYRWIRLIGRLSPGVTRQRAQTAVSLAFAAGFSATERNARHPTVTLGPTQEARGPTPSGDASVALWLAVVAGMVLLIACANVANLLLARALDRRREVSLRRALGADRARIARQFVLEAVLLSAAGGAAALLASAWSSPALGKLLLPADVTVGAGLDWRVATVTILVALVTGVLAGAIPAMASGGTDLTTALHGGDGRTTLSRSRLRSALLVGQVALTLVLLAGVGLFIRSLDKVAGRPNGVDPSHVLLARMDLEADGYGTEEANGIYQQLRERLAALPGVSSVSASVGQPFWYSFGVHIEVPGRDSLPQVATGGPYFEAVTPEYFTTMGTPIIAGRGFTTADQRGTEPVIVLNETLARQFWPGVSALGQCVKVGRGGPCRTVIGIAANVRREDVTEGLTQQLYIPFAQADSTVPSRLTGLLVRTSGPAPDAVTRVRDAMQTLAADLPYASVEPYSSFIDQGLRPWRLGVTLFGTFGALALTLAAVGLYGVLTYLVTQRRREMGIRMALGARRLDVMRLVMAQATRWVAGGLALGLLGALLAGRLLGDLLYGIRPWDPAAVAGSLGVLLLASTIACYLPARRATRIDPVKALRDE